MVIQAIFLLDTLDKDVNSFSMRVRHVLVLHKHFMLLKLASLLSIKVSRLVILIVLLGDFLVIMLIMSIIPMSHQLNVEIKYFR